MAETQNIAVNALPVEAPQKTDYLLGIGASEEFRATVEDFVEATDVVSDLANGMVGKNLCNPNQATETANGGTLTNNGDGTYTINGTFTAQQTWNLTNPSMELPAGKYIVSGITGGSASTYKMVVNKLRSSGSYQTIVNDLYTGDREIDLTSDYGGAIRVYIQCQNGYTASDLSVKPMIRKATIKDDTYVPYQRPISAVEEEISYHNSSGYLGKNLLPNFASSATINGVTWTKHADGHVEANGTASGNSNFIILSASQWNALGVPAGDYVLTGCPAGGSSSKYRLYAQFYDGTTAKNLFDNGTGARNAFENPPTLTSGAIVAQVMSGQTASNLTFYPMLRPATIEDPTYVPYSRSNVDLTQNFADELTANQNSGFARKNLVPLTEKGSTINGITYTFNNDGTITANGTATANAPLTITSREGMVGMGLDADSDYILSGCPAGGAQGKYILYIDQLPNIIDEGNGAIFKGSELAAGNRVLRIIVYNGQTVNNLVFKPMIRPATIEDGTYVPYAPSNSALNADLTNTSSAEIKTGATVRKNNKTVWLSLVNLAVTASTILNVPTGFRPLDRVSFLGNWKNTSNQYESVLITVWSSGDVVAFSPTLNANISNGTLTASGVWLTS